MAGTEPPLPGEVLRDIGRTATGNIHQDDGSELLRLGNDPLLLQHLLARRGVVAPSPPRAQKLPGLATLSITRLLRPHATQAAFGTPPRYSAGGTGHGEGDWNRPFVFTPSTEDIAATASEPNRGLGPDIGRVRHTWWLAPAVAALVAVLLLWL